MQKPLVWLRQASRLLQSQLIFGVRHQVHRIATIVLLVLAAVSLGSLGEASISVRNATYTISSGPEILIMAALMLAAFFVVFSKPIQKRSERPPTRIRAIIAAHGDFLFVGILALSLSNSILIGVESLRAGQLVWTVEREAIWSDYLSIFLWPTIGIVFFLLPIANSKYSVGHYFAKVAMVPKSYKPSYCELALLTVPAFVSIITSWQYVFLTSRWKERVSDVGSASMLGFDVYEDA